MIKQSFCLRLPNPIKQKLIQQSKKENCSQAELIRIAIIEYLKEGYKDVL